jgi:hypothetical protein
MAGYAGSCHAVAPQTLPLVCPRRISDAPQPAVHRQLHFSPHPTYAAPLPRTPKPPTTPLILHTSYCLPICSADGWGSGTNGRGPVVRKGVRWPGRGPGGPERGPVTRKGVRCSGRGPGGPERGPVVRKGVRWPGRGPGGPEGGPVVRKGARWSSRDQRTDYVEYVYVSLGKVTVKFNLEQATKTQRGS